MTQLQAESPDATLAAVLFNAGLAAKTQGHLEEASEAFQVAARLRSDEPQFAIVACKACFAVNRYEEAAVYLTQAEEGGADKQTVKQMSHAIRRAQIVEASDRFPVRFKPGPMDPPGASWVLVFCDWLEATVHELCQDLRAGVAKR